ncbi:MAG: hypothetical protein GF308_11490 [Candidatus Heimdallarchaeota archaeon]|nr:hypothetical protein [Candidatus Heimdallarchaeota archaeon]
MVIIEEKKDKQQIHFLKLNHKRDVISFIINEKERNTLYLIEPLIFTTTKLYLNKFNNQQIIDYCWCPEDKNILIITKTKDGDLIRIYQINVARNSVKEIIQYKGLFERILWLHPEYQELIFLTKSKGEYKLRKINVSKSQVLDCSFSDLVKIYNIIYLYNKWYSFVGKLQYNNSKYINFWTINLENGKSFHISKNINYDRPDLLTHLQKDPLFIRLKNSPTIPAIISNYLLKIKIEEGRNNGCMECILTGSKECKKILILEEDQFTFILLDLLTKEKQKINLNCQRICAAFFCLNDEFILFQRVNWDNQFELVLYDFFGEKTTTVFKLNDENQSSTPSHVQLLTEESFFIFNNKSNLYTIF